MADQNTAPPSHDLSAGTPSGETRTLLIVDDDDVLRQRLAAAMERRGYRVSTAADVGSATSLARRLKPAYAVVDLKIPGGSGLEVVRELHAVRSDMRIVMLTGYGNIATAVAAMKVGAIDYLAKPADADDIDRALNAAGQLLPPPPDNPMSADRIRWEHIHRVYEQCERNVSETARRLNMHRRTLQRILSKRSPHE
jgi:two-component system response regulator RegA